MNDAALLGRPAPLFLADVARAADGIRRRIAGRKVVVTGGAGSLGSALVSWLLASTDAAEVVSLDTDENRTAHLSRRTHEHAARFRPEITDVRSAAAVDECRGAVVFHCAARKHVRLTQSVRTDVLAVNFHATRALADAVDPADFVFVSTDKACDPTVWYGQTKRMAEDHVVLRGGRAVRLCNLFRSNGSLGALIEEDVRAGRPVVVPNGVVRHFVSIEEGALAVLLTFAQEPGRYAVDIDKATRWSMIEMAEAMLHAMGSPVELQATPTPIDEKPVEIAVGNRDGSHVEIVRGLLRIDD